MGLHVRWLGRVPLRRGARPAARPVRARRRRPPAAARAPARVHARRAGRPPPRAGAAGVGRRRAGAAPTGAATSPTTAPASSSATRSSRCRPSTAGTSGMADTVAYVRAVEQLLIDALADLGLPGCGRLASTPACGSSPTAPARARSRPSACASPGVARCTASPSTSAPTSPCSATSCRAASPTRRSRRWQAEGVDVAMQRGGRRGRRPRRRWRWGGGVAERQDVAWRVRPDDLSAVQPRRGPGRDRDAGGTGAPAVGPAWPQAGVTEGLAISRAQARLAAGQGPHRAPTTSGSRRRCATSQLVTVCEEAGCPNIFECWADGTATFMINGERCTRACGFCLVDTRQAEDRSITDEPERVAEAVARMGLDHAVRHRGGPRRPRRRRRGRVRRDHPRHPPRARRATAVEVLIPDCKGDGRRPSTPSSTPGPTC